MRFMPFLGLVPRSDEVQTSSSKASSDTSTNYFEVTEDQLEFVEFSDFLRSCLRLTEAGTTQFTITCTFCPPSIEKHKMTRRYRNCAATGNECIVKY